MLDDYIGQQGQSAPTRRIHPEPGDHIAIVAGPYPSNVGKMLRVTGGTRDLIEATPLDDSNTLIGHDSEGIGYINIGPGQIAQLDPGHIAVVL